MAFLGNLLLVCLSVSAVFANANEDSIHNRGENHFFLHRECLNSLQTQINEELHASLVYLNLAAHFNKLDIARTGFAKFFDESSKEEREHAKKIIDYVNQRGGTVETFAIKMPSSNTWSSGLSALESAMRLEERVNEHLHHLHDKASKICEDPHLMDFIEHEFLTEQVDSIAELKRYISKLSAMDSGLGEYLLDKELSGSKIEL